MSDILDSLGLSTLRYHYHTLLGSAFVCSIILQLSQLICPRLFPETYPKLQGAKRLNWDGTTNSLPFLTMCSNVEQVGLHGSSSVLTSLHSNTVFHLVHVVSTFHATTSVLLSAPLLWNETLMQDKIFGYDYHAGQVYALTCG